MHVAGGVQRQVRSGLFSFGHKDESPADQFASWLPYISYLDEEQLFVNKDGMGFILEVMPQSGADDRMVDVLVSLYSNCPPDTGIQFHLFASPHICPPLRRYANLRMEDRDQIQKAQALRPASAQRQPLPQAGPAPLRAPVPRRSPQPDPGLPLHDPRLPPDGQRLGQGRPRAICPTVSASSALRDGMATTLRSASLAQPRLRRGRPDQLVFAVRATRIASTSGHRARPALRRRP
jgi:hypothetical protein